MDLSSITALISAGVGVLGDANVIGEKQASQIQGALAPQTLVAGNTIPAGSAENTSASQKAATQPMSKTTMYIIGGVAVVALILLIKK